MAKKPSSSHKVRYLKVPNAQTIEQFKIEAEGAWEKAHTPKRRGRPSERETIWNMLNNGLMEEDITPETSQNKLVLFVKDRLSIHPHEDTIRKYAKVWKIMQKRSLNRVKRADASWIEEHAPDAWLIFQQERRKEKERYKFQMSRLRKEIKHCTEQISKMRTEGPKKTIEFPVGPGRMRWVLEHDSSKHVSQLKGEVKRINNEIAALKKWWNGPD